MSNNQVKYMCGSLRAPHIAKTQKGQFGKSAFVGVAEICTEIKSHKLEPLSQCRAKDT